MIGSQLLYFLPRDNIVQHAEFQRKTVIEYAPESNQAQDYRNLAEKLENNTNFCVPKPISDDELEELLLRHSKSAMM
jgi:nitrogenase iron protein NifH